MGHRRTRLICGDRDTDRKVKKHGDKTDFHREHTEARLGQKTR